MGNTRENSATYLLVSNFQGTMFINTFLRYLNLSNINISNNAVFEDGTHRIFETPSMKVRGQPDMYILDNSKKILVIIENKVKKDRELENAQISKDGYFAIIQDYIADGYDAKMVYLIPENYKYESLLRTTFADNDEVSIITWNKFFDNFDNDLLLQPIKKAIQAIDIDGIEKEENILTHEVDFSLISPTIRINEDIADFYIKKLLEDSCKFSENNKRNLLKIDTLKIQRPRKDNWWFNQLTYTEYCDSPCIEIVIQDDDEIYMVAGYDYIKQDFCVYIKNKKNNKVIVEYSNEISLPKGIIKSYYALKNSLCEKLHDFIEREQNSIPNNPNLN